MTRRLTRRQALVRAAGGFGGLTAAGGVGGLVAALGLDGCGSGGGTAPAADGSTLHTTWGDPVGDGQLRVLPGESLIPRTELGPRVAMLEGELVTLAHLTDAHVMDAASPARVPFLDRLGPPFQSTFRPQEALTAHVFDDTLRAVAALSPHAVVQGGDLIDNAQTNELTCALTLLSRRPGRAQPGSGPDGYFGVQSESDPDPFYYRPDLDAPRHAGILQAATRSFVPHGLETPWYPVLGDHDILVQGELVPISLTQSLALGTRALWDLPQGLTLPPGFRVETGGSPDGPLLPGIVDQLLQRALNGPTVSVPADPGRRELTVAEAIDQLSVRSALASHNQNGTNDGPLDYSFDPAESVRVIVLDLARRAGGSGGLVVDGQADWVASQLASAGTRWVIVFSHQPLISSEGGDAILARLDEHPRMVATLAGHIHRNSIIPRRTRAGGYWMITTASLVDYPQQARALKLVATQGGGIALQTWMIDHVQGPPITEPHGSPLAIGTISRQLAYIDAQGGRPLGFAGAHADRNATLYRAAL